MKTKFYILVIDNLPEYTDTLGNVRQDVIHRVWWTVEPKNKDEVFQVAGHVNLDISDLTQFIPANNVTKEQLSAWALERMTPEQREEIEFYIERYTQNN